MSESGGIGPIDGDTAKPPLMPFDPQNLYDLGKNYFDAFLNSLPHEDRKSIKDKVSNTEMASTHEVASIFRRFSDWLWQYNDWLNLVANFGRGASRSQIPIQEHFNNKLVTLDDNGALHKVKSDDFVTLFKKNDEANWPNLVLTANHARAWQSDDLVELLDGVQTLASDAAKSLGAQTFPKHTLIHNRLADGAGKTIFSLACYTEKDVYLNGAELIDRRIELENDMAGNADPAKRSIKHISPASLRLAKLILKLVAEPDLKNPDLVNLDRAEPDSTKEKTAHFTKDPRVVADHNLPLTLRADAAKIAQHIKLIGYSKGANTVSDALRFLYLEFAGLKEKERLKVRGSNGKERLAAPEDIKTIISNIGLLSLAPGEVPLTKAEKEVAGIKRTTILNTNDLTAGHLVNPDEKDYNRWYDRLIKIEGTEVGSGHSITEALGSKRHNKVGFIMKASNDPHFIAAQDEVRAFVASNIGVNAATSVCLSPEPNASGGKDNVLLVQFAPGVTRARKADLEQEFITTLHRKGFEGATVESDLEGRRRLRIVLDHKAANHPIISNEGDHGPVNGCNHAKVMSVRDALEVVNKNEGNNLYLIQDVGHYFEGLLKDYPDNELKGQRAHNGQVKAPKQKKVA